MALRKFKPTTPGQRNKIISAFDEITTSTPEKSLVVGKKDQEVETVKGK
jgi:large subunit ribosomal protein L2